MSGTLGAIAGLLGDLTGWRSSLQRASFRGVPFHVDGHEHATGRRVVVHEFPLRDATSTEDMGRAGRKFGISAYVIGADYHANRDALLKACEGFEEPGTLIHPYLGEWQVRCETCTVRENKRDGGMAVFTLGFVEAGEVPSPEFSTDTAGGLLSGAANVLTMARTAFRAAYEVVTLVELARTYGGAFMLSLAGDMAGKLLGLPGINMAGIVAAIDGLGNADAGDAEATALAICVPFTALADAAAGTTLAPLSGAAGPDAVGSTVTTSRAEAERPTGWPGALLLPYAAWADPAIAPVDLGSVWDGVLLTNRTVLEGLTRDAAVAAAVQSYATAEMASAAAADAARDALADALRDRMDAAADAGADDLFAAWRALLARLVAHHAARAAGRPRLAAYALPGTVPALALSYRLHGSAVRADELVALNRAPHPAFLPGAGVYRVG